MFDVKDIANMVSGALQNILETEVEKAKEEVKDQGVFAYFNDTMGNIVHKMKENFPDIVKALQDNSEVTVENVPENIKDEIIQNYLDDDDNKEEIAKDWIYDNLDEAFEYTIQNTGSYDLKDKIKDMIDEL